MLKRHTPVILSSRYSRIDPQFRSQRSRERDNLLAHRFDDGDRACAASGRRCWNGLDRCTLELFLASCPFVSFVVPGCYPHPIATGALGAEWHVDDDRCWLRLTSGALGAWEPPEIAPRHHAPRSSLFRLASGEFMSRGWGREARRGHYGWLCRFRITRSSGSRGSAEVRERERVVRNLSWLASW